MRSSPPPGSVGGGGGRGGLERRSLTSPRCHGNLRLLIILSPRHCFCFSCLFYLSPPFTGRAIPCPLESNHAADWLRSLGERRDGALGALGSADELRRDRNICRPAHMQNTVNRRLHDVTLSSDVGFFSWRDKREKQAQTVESEGLELLKLNRNSTITLD